MKIRLLTVFPVGQKPKQRFSIGQCVLQMNKAVFIQTRLQFSAKKQLHLSARSLSALTLGLQLNFANSQAALLTFSFFPCLGNSKVYYFRPKS